MTRAYRKSKKVKRLTAEAVRSFSELFLQAGYDGATDSPAVHDEWWDMFCQNFPRVAIAAPRGHAKSTALTLAYTMANIAFRYKKFVVIVGDTEDTANNFLSTIRDQFRINEELRNVFGVKGFERDGVTDCIITFEDGHRARIMTRGAGQKVRGMLWHGTRPDLIMVDDLENDEAVESDDRRKKLKAWLLKALFPAISDERGEIRVVGTILHHDSALKMLLESSSWRSKLYKAHESFDNFSNLLWPEKWTEEKLKAIRQTFIDSGDPEGYSQEYLNDPSDIHNPFFREEDFIPMSEEDRSKPKTYYVGCDFALSDKNYSDYSVLVVGGYDADGVLHIVDERRVRTDDTAVIVDELFSVMARWQPMMYIYESGVLANSITPPFQQEMLRRNMFAEVKNYPAVTDKRSRAVPIQQRMRTGGVRYDDMTSWFEDHRHELRRFPRGKKKDRVDAVAWLGRAINDLAEAPTAEEVYDEEWNEEYYDTMDSVSFETSITGY